MKITGSKFRVWFMDENPTKYEEMTNSKGQLVEFFEHPTRGDSAVVYALVDKTYLVNTGFFEVEEIAEVGGDYEIIIQEGKVYSGWELYE